MRRRFGITANVGLKTISLCAAAAMALVFWPVAASGRLGTAETALTFTPSNHVTFTLQGCRNTGNITLPNNNGDFICDDSAYTTGNLGKGWNELDLVPHRLTTQLGTQSNATTDYNVVVAADNCNYTVTDNGFTCEDNNVGSPGYDDISAPVVNSDESDASCSVSSDPVSYRTAFGGGTDIAIYRTVTIHQSKGTTCVLDYYQRLALGSHLFPGSSLQSYMFQDSGFSIGKKTISIPVNEIAPQKITKDMSATQGSDHTWDITKTPGSANLSFGNTCDPNTPTHAGVSVTVAWTKEAANPDGPITVITHVYATNPASRVIRTTVTDVIRSGTTVLDTAPPVTMDVPANTTTLLLTHQTTVAEGTTDLNDVATATYTDAVTGVPVPGDTTATASAQVQFSGPEQNQTAVVTDSESIAGSSLTFSADSFLPAAVGSFDTPYVAGTETTGPVGWTSVSQSGSGGVTFSKTVYVDGGVTTSGTLSDTATLTGSNGFTTSANASVSISAHPLVSLTITKTISAKVGSAQTFYFDVSGPTPSTGNAVTIAAGSTSNSITLTGLEPGNYTVHEETPASPWTASVDHSVDLSNACTGGVTMANTFQAAVAKASKVTNPSGNEAGWSLTLHGNDGSTDQTIVTAGAGLQSFTKTLVDGVTYTISEQGQSGWDQTGISGSSNLTVGTSSCSFTVDYPADAGAVFSCTFTNTERGSLKVTKSVNWNGITPDTNQTFVICIKGPSYPLGTESGACHTYGSSGGDFTFSNLLPGNYLVTETSPGTTWTVTGSGVTVGVSAGQQGSATITNARKLGSLQVTKTVNWIGSTPDTTKTFQICIQGPSYPLGTETGACKSIGYNGGTLTWSNLIPGSYTVAETNPGSQWTVVVTGSPATVPTDGGQATASVSNTLQPGKAKVVKTVSNAPPSGIQAFTFTLRQGASVSSDGTILGSALIANAGNGGVLNFSTNLVPGNHYQMCEDVMPGWNTNLGPNLFVPSSIIPPNLPNPNVNNMTVCTDFVATAGSTTTFTVDNSPPPGGRALTIGFWKNWASCTTSSANKKPVLDQTLATATGLTTNPPAGLVVSAQYPGVGWPNFAATYYLVLKGNTSAPNVAPDCSNAVNLLNKTTINGKSKMSSDPLFNMAAQLIGAELNYFAGAGKNGTTTVNIQRAVLLLGSYSFNGLTYSPKVSSADASTANCLATQLDNYNNDRSVSTCP